MHLITIVVGFAPVSLLYSKPELADKTFADIEIARRDKVDTVVVTDEFGQHGLLSVAGINAVLKEDMDQSSLAQIERGLHQLRTQQKANSRASSDPALRHSAAMSPAIISPMGNGRFPS